MKSLKKVKKKWFLYGAAGLFAILGAAGYRVRKTPEWRVLAGSVGEREVICRALVEKSRVRARWCLGRLLWDPSPRVRLAALAALRKRPLPELNSDVERLTERINLKVQASAYEYLLEHAGGDTERIAVDLGTRLKDPGYRQANKPLLGTAIAHAMKSDPYMAASWALSVMFRDRVYYPEAARVVLRHPKGLAPARGWLVDQLDKFRGEEEVWQFILAALTATDGQMRGYVADDWKEPAPRKGKFLPGDEVADRFTFEAEWAFNIRPNLQIDQWEGERTLYLNEGGGGYNDWLQGADSTVDIGTGKFQFYLEKPGKYQVWVHIWMANKCANSTGMKLDGEVLGYFRDKEDVFDKWVWVPALEPGITIYLRKGRHTFDLQAIEDEVFVDKYVLLPAEEKFSPKHLPPRSGLFTSGIPSSISFTFEKQAQARGTTQCITLWVRRNSEEIAGGKLRLEVPPPFHLVGKNETDVVFEDANPIARSTFIVELPRTGAAGEVELRATFSSGGKILATGKDVLGAFYDWFTTGPLDPDSPKTRELLEKKILSREELRDGWTRFSVKGYDRYRRMDFEKAYGQSRNNYIFLYTEFEVAETGDYWGLLTLDDSGFIWLDGKKVEGRSEELQGEGRLMMTQYRIAKGRHQVLAWVYQADFPDPAGKEADRRSYNNWNFKWLLRKQRHVIAPGICGYMIDLDSAFQSKAPPFLP